MSLSNQLKQLRVNKRENKLDFSIQEYSTLALLEFNKIKGNLGPRNL